MACSFNFNYINPIAYNNGSEAGIVCVHAVCRVRKQQSNYFQNHRWYIGDKVFACIQTPKEFLARLMQD